MHFSIDRTVHTTAFDKPVVDHWLERKIAQTAGGSTEKDRSDDRPLQRRARYRLSYIPLHVLFNDALNTFYLRLYGVRHMVKYHSDSERGNPLHIPLTAFGTPVVEHWLEREIAQRVHNGGSIRRHHRTMSEHSYHGATSPRKSKSKSIYIK